MGGEVAKVRVMDYTATVHCKHSARIGVRFSACHCCIKMT